MKRPVCHGCPGYRGVEYDARLDCRVCWLARFSPGHRRLWDIEPIEPPPWAMPDGSIMMVATSPAPPTPDMASLARPASAQAVALVVYPDCEELGPTVDTGERCQCAAKVRACGVHKTCTSGVPKAGHMTCSKCRDYRRLATAERPARADRLEQWMHPQEVVEDGWLDGPPLPKEVKHWENVRDAAAWSADDFARQVAVTATWPESKGRGVVIAGGDRYWPGAYVSAAMARHFGPDVGIQVWYLGGRREGIDDYRRRTEKNGVKTPDYHELFKALGVELVDADRHPARGSARVLNGWELKLFAVIHSGFREALFLDADAYPVAPLAGLFAGRSFQESGCVLWPDLPETNGWTDWTAWRCKPDGRYGVDTGQMLWDVEQARVPLHLAHWYNMHSDVTYGLPGWDYGDKGPVRAAFARLGRRFGQFGPDVPNWHHPAAFIHAGPDGPAVVHRCRAKFQDGRSGFYTPQTEGCMGKRFPGLPCEDLAWSFARQVAVTAT